MLSAYLNKEEEEDEREEERAKDAKEKDMLLLSKVPCFKQKACPVFVEGVGSTFVVMISPRVEFEDFVEMVQTKTGLPSEAFFLSFLCRVLDSVRMKDLTRDSSVRVNFRLRCGMMRVPRDSPGQWTCDYCGINRCWATRSTCYRCGEARGHTEDLQRHYRNMAREAREKGTSGASAAVGSSSTSPRVRCLRELLRRLLGLLPSLFRKWTRSTTPTKLLFFERLWHCLRTATFRQMFSMRFGKLFLRIVLRRGKRRKFLGSKSC